MKVLFVYPYEQAIDSEAYELQRVDEHLVQFNFAIAILSAVLKDVGHETALLPIYREDQIEKIDGGDADIFAFSYSEAESEWVFRISRILRDTYPHVPQVMGGIGPTLQPIRTFFETQADYVCVGEGEYALPELLRRIEQGADTAYIPNLSTRKNGIITWSEGGQVVENLDSLPFYDYELFDQFPLKHLQSNLPRIYYLASRNCAFRCSFCANARKRKAMNAGTNYVRRYSPGRVINELLYLKARYPQVKVVHFNDEIIHYDKAWFREMTTLYKEHIRLPWRSYASLAMIDAETIELMQGSNCYRVNVGIEAGSQRIRKDIYRRPQISNEDIIKRLKMLKDAGISVHASNLFGAPTETLDEMLQTVRLNARGGVDIPVSGIVVPYENTDLYDIALELGKLDQVVYANKGVSITGVAQEKVAFLREYFAELVKIYQYAISLGPDDYYRVDQFITWLVKESRVDFSVLLKIHELYFKGKTMDAIYNHVEKVYGRSKQ